MTTGGKAVEAGLQVLKEVGSAADAAMVTWPGRLVRLGELPFARLIPGTSKAARMMMSVKRSPLFVTLAPLRTLPFGHSHVSSPLKTSVF